MKAKRNLILLLSAMLLAGFAAEAQPVITQQPTNQTVIVGGSVTFNVVVSGIGPFTYQWLFNGTNLPNVSNAIITTDAGNGTYGYSGDGSTATNAELYYPFGAAVDGGGNLFIADTYNCRIRKVTTNGIMTSVAGNGTGGYYSGDGSAATNARLNYPYGVAVDGGGNLFIADTYNCRIRKVATNGIISTVAGNGTYGYSGDGSAATNAMLSVPYGVAVDGGGNLFIADYSSNRIRKVATNGIISTVAGNGPGGYSGDGSAATNAELTNPFGVAVDGGGNLFIADYGNFRIRKVATNGIMTTVAGNGTHGYSGDGSVATNAALNYPCGVAVDGGGNLFIADTINFRIRKVATNGIMTTVAGNGAGAYSGDGSAATNAALNFPYGVAVDGGGNLFIADTDNYRIRKVSSPSPAWSLALNNVLANKAGNYSVIISNSTGSVTSILASLTVVLPGYNQISSPVLNNGKMRLSFVGIHATNYALERSFSLSPANWIPQVTNPADVNGNLIFTNTPVSTTNNFWRIRSVP